MKYEICTKLETAKERCPIVFQCHPSNFKVTQDKTSPILTQIGRFGTIGRSQLSNPSDLPCYPNNCEKNAEVNTKIRELLPVKCWKKMDWRLSNSINLSRRSVLIELLPNDLSNFVWTLWYRKWLGGPYLITVILLYSYFATAWWLRSVWVKNIVITCLPDVSTFFGNRLQHRIIKWFRSYAT